MDRKQIEANLKAATESVSGIVVTIGILGTLSAFVYLKPLIRVSGNSLTALFFHFLIVFVCARLIAGLVTVVVGLAVGAIYMLKDADFSEESIRLLEEEEKKLQQEQKLESSKPKAKQDKWIRSAFILIPCVLAYQERPTWVIAVIACAFVIIDIVLISQKQKKPTA